MNEFGQKRLLDITICLFGFIQSEMSLSSIFIQSSSIHNRSKGWKLEGNSKNFILLVVSFEVLKSSLIVVHFKHQSNFIQNKLEGNNEGLIIMTKIYFTLFIRLKFIAFNDISEGFQDLQSLFMISQLFD